MYVSRLIVCPQYKNAYSVVLIRLDIVGSVALSHSFSAQSARPNDTHSDAAQIHASWTSHVNTGLKPLAFLAPLVVRAFPAVANAPLPLMQTQGAIKTIVRRIGQQILDREQSAFDGKREKTPGDSDSETPANYTGRAKDIISVLLRSRRLGNSDGAETISDEHILDNVHHSFSCPINRLTI